LYSLALIIEQRSRETVPRKPLRKEVQALLELASAKGYSRAQCSLATMYLDALNNDDELSRPLELFKLAADQGLAEAQFALGCFYERGVGVTLDCRKARELYSAAAAQNLAHAQYRLGAMYEKGRADYAINVDEVPVEALELFRKAADQGLAHAQYALGRYQYFRKPYEPTKVRTVVEAAASQGLVSAQTTLGVLLVNGIGVERDVAAALQWFTVAAAQLHRARNVLMWSPSELESAVDACVYLGTICACGADLGGSPDARMSLKYIESAASANHSAGLHVLALMYANGLGVERDQTQATQMHYRTIESGCIPLTVLDDLEQVERSIIESLKEPDAIIVPDVGHLSHGYAEDLSSAPPKQKPPKPPKPAHLNLGSSGWNLIRGVKKSENSQSFDLHAL
jgi:TPR repeat protein